MATLISVQYLALVGPNGKGGNTRIDDYEKSLNQIVDYAIENNIDAFIQTGDVFDSRTPAPEHMNVVNRAIKRLSLANIVTIFIMGNHDYRRTSDGFTSSISSLAAKDYSNVRIILQPEVVTLSKTINDISTGTSLLLLPYRDRRMYPGMSTKEDSAYYEKEVEALINSCQSGLPIVAVGHNFYHTGSYSDYAGTEILANPDAFSKCDLVAMGHYHEFKIMKKKDPIAIYTGSMERLNFGDEKIEKYFLDYNTDIKKVKIIKIKSRDMLDIVMDLTKCTPENLMDTCVEEIKSLELKDKIVRYKMLVQDIVMPFVKRNLIENELYENKAFYVSRVAIEPVFQKIIRDEAILEHADDFSIFEAFLKDQSLDEHFRLKILNEAKKIIEAK